MKPQQASRSRSHFQEIVQAESVQPAQRLSERSLALYLQLGLLITDSVFINKNRCARGIVAYLEEKGSSGLIPWNMHWKRNSEELFLYNYPTGFTDRCKCGPTRTNYFGGNRFLLQGPKSQIRLLC